MTRDGRSVHPRISERDIILQSSPLPVECAHCGTKLCDADTVVLDRETRRSKHDADPSTDNTVYCFDCGNDISVSPTDGDSLSSPEESLIRYLIAGKLRNKEPDENAPRLTDCEMLDRYAEW